MTHVVGDPGHTADHNTIEATQATHTTQIAALPGTYGALASGNTWTGRQLFNAVGNDGSTGNGFDYTGTVADATPSGGYFNRASSAVTFTGGTNGTRGDSVASDAANGTGATFFAGEFIGMEAGGGFVGKGSTQGFYFRGILGANGASAYGELGGFLSDVTSNRPGGLLEGMEVKTTDNVGSRTAAYVGVVNQNNLTVPYWARGLWLTSAGTHLAGDAVYVDGAAGWSSFARFKNSGGTTVFAMDATGKQFIGTHGVTLYDDGSGNLKTDNVLIAPDFFTTGDVTANDFLYQADSTRKILWGTGAPAVAASVGSLFLRTDGGAATTLYVKESGTGTTGWVAK